MLFLTRLSAAAVAVLAVAFAVAWFTASPAVTLLAKPKPVTVQSQPVPSGRWTLNGAGSPGGTPVTSAPDTSPGSAHPLSGGNVIWCPQGGCAAFDASKGDAALATSGPVLDTSQGRSFTVSARVELADIPPNHLYATAVSQDGATTPDGNVLSGFYLQLDGQDQSWSFSLGPGKAKTGPGSAAPGRWAALTGVYDGPSNTATLYVNGTQAAVLPEASPYASNGPLVIGRAQWENAPADWWPGEIRDVEVFGQALTPAQVQGLYRQNGN